VLAVIDLGLTILGNGCFIGDVARCRADARGSVGLQLVRAVRWSLDEARIALMGITDGEFFIAIEDNEIRGSVYELACEMALRPAKLIHPTAIISPSAQIGEGSIVLERAVVNAAAVVGRDCVVGVTATVDHDCTLGDHVHLQTRVALGGDVRIGRLADVGIGATILPGVQIGDAAFIGPRSVVIRNVPRGARISGIPARTILAAEETV
jgi:acetyltransferase EpsM